MRVFTVEFENVSVLASQDLLELGAGDDRPVALIGYDMINLSDVGDAQEEILRCRIIRGHTTSGSGGSAPTPRPLDPDDAAAGFTSEVNNTTIASVGTAINLASFGFNVRIGTGPVFLPPSLYFKTTQAAGLLVVRLMAAPADALTVSGTFYVAEGI